MKPSTPLCLLAVLVAASAACRCSSGPPSPNPEGSEVDGGIETADGGAPDGAAESGTEEAGAPDTGTTPAPALLIDTDMGLDDARVVVSIPMQSKYHVAGIVTVEGTAGAAKGADNALRLLGALGIDTIPVAVGSTKTAAGASVPAPSWRPMAEGLGGLTLPAAARQPEAVDGVTFERDLLRNASHSIDVLSIGPVSNLALVLTQEPELSNKIHAVYLLGDYGECVGYNCTTDKGGAKTLLDSGIPTYMLLAAQTATAPFDAAFLASVKTLTGPAAELVTGFMSSHADGNMKLWDDGVLATMLDAKVATYAGSGGTQKSTALEVETLHALLLGLWDTPTPAMP